jgi:hypothetical protein
MSQLLSKPLRHLIGQLTRNYPIQAARRADSNQTWLVNLGSKETAKAKPNQSKYFGVAEGMLGNSILRRSLSVLVLKEVAVFLTLKFKDPKFFAKAARARN